ncbi:MAG: ABC transporter permease [Acidobacteria bacterium]|nr:ABC transporter permease [Acidobacteriota bacterium]
MRQLRGWLVRLFGLFSRKQREREFAEELESHLAFHIEDNLRAGMSPEEARRRALIKLGGVTLTQELHREQRGLPMLETLFQDLRFGLRMLRKHPSSTLIAILTLAVGIGASSALFSLFDALMWRTLSAPQPEQLVLFRRAESSNRTIYDVSYPIFERLREQPQVFTEVAANWLIERSEPAANPGADSGQVRVGMASGNYFATLGVEAVSGRTFTPDDNRVPGGHPVAVISHGYWQSRFALAPDIVGRTLTLTGTTYTIIGVTPRGFTGEWVGRPADLWVPFMMASQVMPEVPGGSAKFPALVIARLKPDVSQAQAQAASQLIYQQSLLAEAGSNLTAEQRQFIAQRRIELESAASGYSAQRQALTQPLAILAGMVGLVLLAVCANVANLLLARAATREREMAVRQALGAGRVRIARQLLTESLLLALAGGAAGLLFAVWGTNLLSAMLMAGPLSTGIEDNSLVLYLRLDGRVIACAALMCLFICLVVGLAPAFRSSQVALTAALKERSTGNAGRGRGRFSLGKLLVITQVALSLVLLVGAGLFLRTLRNLQSQETGFERNQLLMVWAAPVRTGRTVPALADFAQSVQQRLATLPGVQSVSVSTGGLLDGNVRGGQSETLQMQGQTPKPGLAISSLGVSPGFFATVGTPLLAGRDFTAQDGETAPQVAILSETMARFFFGNENPIGKRFNAMGGTGFPLEIVGVAKDAKLGTPRDSRGAWYFPYRQNARFLRLNWCIALRTSGEPTTLTASVNQALRELDPSLPVLRFTTLEEQLNRVLAQERLLAALAGFFGVLAALLACLGLYGVIAYTVARRTHEIGLRLALGATPMNVLWRVLRESLWLALGGIALGIPAALAATRLISARLYGVSPNDPLTLVAAMLLMLGVAVASALVPARRAANVDPMVALRHE